MIKENLIESHIKRQEYKASAFLNFEKTNFKTSKSDDLKRNNFRRRILLSRDELIRIEKLLIEYNEDIYNIYAEKLNDAVFTIDESSHTTFKGRLQHVPGSILFHMPPALCGHIMQAIAAVAEDKEDFELYRYFLQWFGIRRRSEKTFNDWIPEDPRGRWEDEPYDGTTGTQFVLDHIGLVFEDEVAMESAVINNKFQPQGV